MTEPRRAATGPIILEQLTLLREEVKEIRETQQRRERQLKGLSVQLDRFLAAELDLTGTLVQVREVVGAGRTSLIELQAAARDLQRTIHGVLELTVGDPQLLERERAA